MSENSNPLVYFVLEGDESVGVFLEGAEMIEVKAITQNSNDVRFEFRKESKD